MAHYLVTGCAGFIGAKVTEFLLADGHCVLGIDNLNSAYDVSLKKWRLEQLKNKKKFRFKKGDITSITHLKKIGDEAGTDGFDGIINLAAYAGVRYSIENPWIYIKTNVTGTLNLLDLCRERGIGKLVLASSSSLYGVHNPLPFKEEADTSRPISPYASSKKAAEELCFTYYHLYGIDITILRFFTVFGPAGRPDMSPFRFVKWISEGTALKVFGDGSQKRDFTYIDDIARGTVAALKPLGYEIINLGSAKPITLKDLIRLIEEVIGRKAKLDIKPKHMADMEATWADVRKAKKLLDWEPNYSLRDGMERLVTWYVENEAWLKKVEIGA